MAKKKSSLRIIGGDWRSRKIKFANNVIIRPTPDRIRETLFNWLSNKVAQAECLDLFAGSGALGFEAASRGAKHVTMVDADTIIADMLIEQKKSFAAQQVDVVHQDALAYLQHANKKFDIVFLDPPFNSELLQHAVTTLNSRELLEASGLIYVESSIHFVQPQCLNAFTCIREKSAGQVRYALYEALN